VRVVPKLFLIAQYLWDLYCQHLPPCSLVPGKVNEPNIVRSKVWKTRIDTNAT